MIDANGDLEVILPPKLKCVAESRHRHIVLRGGRGSAKSWTIARILSARSAGTRLRALCCREIQKSVKQSSKRLLDGQIRALGLAHLFDSQESAIKGPYSSEFVFTGLRDQSADSLKSYEDFDIAWVSEAQSITEHSANILIPTIRNPGSQIIWDYNPDQEDDFIHKMAERAIRTNDPDILVIDVSYLDNPYFPKELELERVKLLELNTDLHDHIYLGKLRNRAGVMFKRRWFKFYDELPSNLSRAYMASDYASSPDPDGEREPDYTEYGCARLDGAGNLYFTDWWYDQCDPHEWIDAGLQMAQTHNALIWYEEKGVLKRALDSSINQAMRDSKRFTYRHALPSVNSKTERAYGFMARCSAGAVYFPRNAPWTERVINQLCAFTGQDGRKDDAVDVCSLLARGLDVMTEPPKDDAPKKKDPEPFTARWLEEEPSSMSDTERSEFYR